MNLAELLRPGVTRPDLDPAIWRRWLEAVHEFARTGGGRVSSDVDKPRSTPDFYYRSYFRVHVDLRGGKRLAILLNAGAMVVAAAEPADPGGLRQVFVDLPDGESFARYGFHLLSAAELEQSLPIDRLDALDQQEQADVRYHGTDRLGDLLFNWCD